VPARDNQDIEENRRKFTLWLIIFCIIYPLWAIFGELGMQEFYFKPLCQSYAAQNSLTFLSYDRGGKMNPAGCVMVGDQEISITDAGGMTAEILYIGTDVIAIILPILSLFILVRKK